MVTKPTATVSMETGPGLSTTNLVLPDVRSLEFDYSNNGIVIIQDAPYKRTEFDLDALAVVVWNPGAATITLS